MRKSILLIIVFLISIAAYFSYIQITAADLPTFGLKLGGEKGKLKDLTKNFLETIQFKNIETLKTFVEHNISNEELDDFFKKTFDMPYQQIDLEKFSIEGIEIDSSKTRCKIKIKAIGTNQLSKEPFTKLKVLYWYFNPNNKLWLIDVKSNLI